MGEYEKKQRNQLNRAISNHDTGNKQLKEVIDKRIKIKASDNYSNPIQKVQPPIPNVPTHTLKGRVISRAFNNLGIDVKWSEDIQRWVFKCYHCKKWITEEAVEADHYPIPQIMGGTNELDNLVLACRPCNAANIHNSRQMVTRGTIEDKGLARKYTE